MNQLQYLGTHNSYHIQPLDDALEVLLAFIPDVAPTLQYTHVALTQQFQTQGIGQIELDVFHDPERGPYSEHKARTLFGEDSASGIPELDEPGLKVLHVQEIDYETAQRDAALASGAHFISTDYPVPNLEFSEYQVNIPGDHIARCNPVNPGSCSASSLSP